MSRIFGRGGEVDSLNSLSDNQRAVRVRREGGKGSDAQGVCLSRLAGLTHDARPSKGLSRQEVSK